MDTNPATAMDAIALGVLLLSSVLALMRGFVRESLSIASFIIASLAAIFTLPVFVTITRNWIQSEILATGVTAFLIFIASYILMTLATHKISGIVRRNHHIGVLDRTIGFAFGLVRGMVLLAIVLLGWNFFTTPQQTPQWVSKARIYPAITATAEILKSLIPNSRMSGIELPKINISAETNKAEQGYEQTDRNILDQVITTKLGDQEKKTKNSDTPTKEEPPK